MNLLDLDQFYLTFLIGIYTHSKYANSLSITSNLLTKILDLLLMYQDAKMMVILCLTSFG